MNIVKVTTSGQITIPKQLRGCFEGHFFTCERVGKTIVFTPLDAHEDVFPKKYTIKDLKKAIFKGRDPKEKNLAGKIDQIVYGL